MTSHSSHPNEFTRNEEWRDIEGYEGYYQVSNLGRIRSLNRLVNGKLGSKVFVKGIIRKPQISKKGYLTVILQKSHKHRTFQIHRLVASAFIPNPLNLPQVNHIDTNKENNLPENLEWITNDDNMAHAIRNGCFKPFTKKQYESVKRNIAIAHKRKQIPVVQLSLDGDFINEYESITEAAKALKLGNGKISMCCNKKRKTCGGFKWMHKEEYINELCNAMRKTCQRP